MIWLLFAHTFGDVAMQTAWLAANKDIWYGTLAHSIIWAGSISIALVCLKRYSNTKAIFLILGHWLIDSFIQNHYLDQALHFIQLIIVYL